MLRRRDPIGWITLVLIATCAVSLSGAEMESRGPQTAIADLEVQPTQIDWLPHTDYEGLILTVAGPEDIYIHQELEAGQTPSLSLFHANGERLPDGTYTYELRVTSLRVSQMLERSLVQTGFLTVRNGTFVEASAASKIPSDLQSLPKLQRRSTTAKDHQSLVVHGNACIGADCTAAGFNDLTLQSDAPSLLFDAGGPFSPNRDWLLQANDFVGGGEYFALVDLGNDFPNRVPFRVQGGAPGDSLYVRNNGNVGLGTSTPGADFHVFGNATDDAFGSAGPNPASGPAFNFGYGGASFGRGAGFLNVRPDASATAPNPSLRFLTANVQRMIITNTGDVGIGTASPGGALHVSRNTGSIATLARLSNNSGVQLLYDRTDAGANDWQTSNFNASFEISIPGSSPGQFNLASNGNLSISGTLSQGSSRDLKTDFASLDPKAVLSRVTALPISLWSYKTETAVRHLGPMAEDFHKAFGLGGNDKYLAPSDQAGVALLAVQGLNQIVQERADEIVILRGENAALERRIAALEAMLSNVMSRGDASGQAQPTPAVEH